MLDSLEYVCEELEELSDFILSSWADERTLRETFGWHHAAVTRHDLAAVSSNLAKRIREADPQTIESELDDLLEEFPRKLKLLRSETIPNMFNGNGNFAVPAYLSTLQSLEGLLEPILGWQTLSDNKAMPAALVRRLRGIQAEIEALVPNKKLLEEQLSSIRDANEAAESLPTDLKSLREARDAVQKLSLESAELFGKIDERSKEAATFVATITKQQEEAGRLVSQCEAAYRITTTKGLAAAFDQRADRLGASMWVWVFGLLSALGIGSWIGAIRVELLSSAISVPDPKWGVVWMQLTLSILSIGAPLWFAWLATKQIGQRFRLAEDYGFKASVAKAYEGYRKEAARIDAAFEARLFASALTRLEEPPLRLVESAAHGSPWHELIGSDAFQKALVSVPELKDKFIELAKSALPERKPDKQSESATATTS
jgi:hypothetical protein